MPKRGKNYKKNLEGLDKLKLNTLKEGGNDYTVKALNEDRIFIEALKSEVLNKI